MRKFLSFIAVMTALLGNAVEILKGTPQESAHNVRTLVEASEGIFVAEKPCVSIRVIRGHTPKLVTGVEIPSSCGTCRRAFR